jgi:hypothetical protein
VRLLADIARLIAWHLLLLLSTIPLVVVATIAVVRWQDGWHSLLLLALAVLATICGVCLVLVWEGFGSLAFLLRFTENFGRHRFSVVPLEDYLRAVRQFLPNESALSDRQLIVQTLPWWAAWHPNRLRIVAVSRSPDINDPMPNASVAFVCMFGAWIILKSPIQELTETQYFTLLHECGHTSPLSFGTRLAAGGNIARALWCVPFLAAAIAPSRLMLGLMIIGSVCWYKLAKLEQSRDSAVAQEEDEIRADMYALNRCHRDWREPQPPADLASRICPPDAPDEIVAKTNRTWTMRHEAFVKNLLLHRQGQHLEIPAALRKRPLATGLESAVADVLAVLCAISVAPLTWSRLGLLTAMVGIMAVLAAVLYFGGLIQAITIENTVRIERLDPVAEAVLQRAKGNSERWAARLSVLRSGTPKKFRLG